MILPRLFDLTPSGNCYKVRLLLTQLGIPFERVPIDVFGGATRTPEFRERFPLGRVPIVELEPGVHVAESNAILWYFAEGTRFVPTDRLERARVLQWMFWEQYSHEPNIAVVRALIAFFGVPAGGEAELLARTKKGYAALDVMDRHLAERPFFAGDAYSIADIALYAYTHVAEEGRFDLARFPAVKRWLARVAAEPGHVPMTA